MCEVRARFSLQIMQLSGSYGLRAGDVLWIGLPGLAKRPFDAKAGQSYLLPSSLILFPYSDL